MSFEHDVTIRVFEKLAYLSKLARSGSAGGRPSRDTDLTRSEAGSATSPRRAPSYSGGGRDSGPTRDEASAVAKKREDKQKETKQKDDHAQLGELRRSSREKAKSKMPELEEEFGGNIIFDQPNLKGIYSDMGLGDRSAELAGQVDANFINSIPPGHEDPYLREKSFVGGVEPDRLRDLINRSLDISMDTGSGISDTNASEMLKSEDPGERITRAADLIMSGEREHSKQMGAANANPITMFEDNFIDRDAKPTSVGDLLRDTNL